MKRRIRGRESGDLQGLRFGDVGAFRTQGWENTAKASKRTLPAQEVLAGQPSARKVTVILNPKPQTQAPKCPTLS